MPAPIRTWRPASPRVRPSRERGHYTSADWRARRIRILVRDAYTCRACSQIVSGPQAHVDHIVPLEEGGSDDPANLQTLCGACHGRKTREEQRRRGYC